MRNIIFIIFVILLIPELTFSYNNIDELIKLAKKGDSESQYILGRCYHYGTDVNKDLKLSAYWYKKSAEQGNSNGINALGLCYENGEGVVKDIKKAISLYHKAADQGNANAQYNIGNSYYLGKGVEVNYQKAVDWYKKSAEQGNAKAQYNLAYCYQYGEGIDRDIEKAIYWYNKSADQGNANAQCNLAYCYEKGEGVDKDLKKAVYWYEKSADQGDISSQSNLGNFYYNGTGVNKDINKSIYWYKKAADQGDSLSQYILGNFYYAGTGVEKDLKKSLYWYQKAADNGNKDAQFNIGTFYYNGIGTNKDIKKAIAWYHKAAINGSSEAKDALMQINADNIDRDAERTILIGSFSSGGTTAPATFSTIDGLYFFNTDKLSNDSNWKNYLDKMIKNCESISIDDGMVCKIDAHISPEKIFHGYSDNYDGSIDDIYSLEVIKTDDNFKLVNDHEVSTINSTNKKLPSNRVKYYDDKDYHMDIILTGCEYNKHKKIIYIYGKTAEFNKIVFNWSSNGNYCKNFKLGGLYYIGFEKWSMENKIYPTAELLTIRDDE